MQNLLLKKKFCFISFLIFLGIIYLTLFSCVVNEKSKEASQIMFVPVNNKEELLEVLDKYGLFDLDGPFSPSFVVIKNLPRDFKEIRDKKVRKKVFIHTVLPSAIVAFAEVEAERKMLLKILNSKGNPKIIELSKINLENFGPCADFLKILVKKYRSHDTETLLKRINTVPLSLLLAQAAIESRWGTSRFAIYGNNLYGIWTYRRKGIVPLKRDPFANHKVAKYDSILDSTRDYLYNLNVGWAYTEFREARLYCNDSSFLAHYLKRYSELGDLYGERIERIIDKYGLRRYDIFASQFKLKFGPISLCSISSFGCKK